MRIEANAVEQKKQKNCEPQRENKSIKLKKNRRRNKKSMAGVSISAVERLFQTCQEVFANCEAGTIPPPDDVDRLRDMLDTLKPADVGLSPDMPHFRTTETERAPPITYLHIYESAKFSMSISSFGMNYYGMSCYFHDCSIEYRLTLPLHNFNRNKYKNAFHRTPILETRLLLMQKRKVMTPTRTKFQFGILLLLLTKTQMYEARVDAGFEVKLKRTFQIVLPTKNGRVIAL